ncbi:MAG: amidohydrolase [Clostridia bacterium]|nr:amidohydrolase [Clostridia bacterium]
MLFQNITVLDENFEVRSNYYVGVRDDRIAYCSDQPPKEDFGEIYDGTNRLLIPSFYNMHSHLPMVFLRGYGENLPLMTWLQTRIFPFEAHLTDDDIYYGCLMGIAEMLRYGIGATEEMYIRQDPLGRAFAESGVKANFAQCCNGFGDEGYFDLPIYKETLETIQKYNGAADGRIRAEFSLHAEYTSTEKIVRGLAETAAKYGSSMHVHVSETAGEVQACRERHGGKSPVRYLADCGLFSVPTVAAHVVHVDDEDIAILKEYGVTVATCPKSNAKLASGICPVSALLKAGVNVAIGTDSVASNNNLNMIEEMRFFNLLQKAATLDPTVITPKETLFAATRAGALAQQRADCGLVKVGFKADLTVLELDRIYLQPEYNVLNNLIYSAAGNDVALTMVDGRVLYRDGNYPTLDIEWITAECEQRRLRILGELAGE